MSQPLAHYQAAPEALAETRGDRPSAEVDSGGGWFRELWSYRELLYFLAWRDVKVRYKQAALGAAWAILQPVLTMVIFTLFFGRLAGVPSDNIPYPLFSFCGLVLWTYFSGSLGQAGQSLVSNSNLITKVYFPRVTLPAASSVSGLLDFSIGLVFLAGMLAYYRVVPGWSILWAPVFLAGLILLSLGAGFILSALNVRFRDVKYATPFLIQLWLFVTPIIYPTTIIPERYKPLAALNPLAGIVEGFRAAMFPGRRLDLQLTAISLAGAVLVFVAGLIYFRKTERAFADVI
jgi:lipopolysaccharide transport system permease protein